jgi:hypothetical protein
MNCRHLVASTAAALLMLSPLVELHASPDTGRQDRLDAIRHARVWTATNIRSLDLKAGPESAGAFTPGQTVTCDFVARPHGSGSTPKFDCTQPGGRELKVRYGAKNGEVYAQVAATRLLWALGFAANRMYPVKVVCRGCTADPFKDHKAAAGATPVTFDPATIDVKAAGKTVETKPEEGWSWKELTLIDEQAGGASPRERDALTLLAVLIQHSSNKAINQRILCLDEPACTHTVMMIADVGKTFGRANALNNDDTGAVNFKEWSQIPVWKGDKGCVGNLPGSWSGTVSNPHIGEPGRAFLANLLDQLSDTQLRDLFEVARFNQRDPSASVADWVAAFKKKRADIAGRVCGE